jgi:ubiquinone/menaquinone biosynthesis C-methylase UbiE
MAQEKTAFNHSTPTLYDRYMGPLLFEPYARLIAERAALFQPARILETAAGTGIVTRALNEALPQAQIVATDLNRVMLDFAAQRVRSKQVAFHTADAQDLPFPDGSFDLVVCQFGVMFFPDKVRANREAWRVLLSGGHYLLVSFDRLEFNPVPKMTQDAVAALFSEDPPDYMERGPFSYGDPMLIEHDLVAAGFADIQCETVTLSSRVRARDAAQGLVLGSPFRSEIERRDPSALDRALNAVTEALRPLDGKDAAISAHVVTASKPGPNVNAQ